MGDAGVELKSVLTLLHMEMRTAFVTIEDVALQLVLWKTYINYNRQGQLRHGSNTIAAPS